MGVEAVETPCQMPDTMIFCFTQLGMEQREVGQRSVFFNLSISVTQSDVGNYREKREQPGCLLC